MIEKIDEDTYFVTDFDSSYMQNSTYNSLITNQYIHPSEYLDEFDDAIKVVTPSSVDEPDISRLLLEDQEFKKSIDRAKEEIKRGDAYLSHEDVFGAG